MKLLVTYVILAIGSCQAKYVHEKTSEHLRVVRAAALSGFSIGNKNNLIANCKENGLTKEDEEKLEDNFLTSEACIDKERIFRVPEEEFSQNIINCSKDLLIQLRNCLRDGQKFLPDYLLELRHSVTSFLYRNKNILDSNDALACVKKLKEPTVQESLNSCIDKASQESVSNLGLPASRPKACEYMEKVSSCYPKIVAANCGSSVTVDQFVQDHKSSLNKPCKA